MFLYRKNRGFLQYNKVEPYTYNRPRILKINICCNHNYDIIVLNIAKENNKGDDDLEQETDKKLYQEFLKGNNSSFEKIVIKHKDKLIYFISTYVKNIDIAEDIAQDVFVYILVHRVNYDFKYSLKTYLFTIAKSKALNYIKREKKIIYKEDINELDYLNNSNTHELEEIVFANEKKQNLYKTINKLKTNYREAIYLADIEELKYSEIGKILKKSQSSTKVLIHRARKELEKLIRKESEKYEG